MFIKILILTVPLDERPASEDGVMRELETDLGGLICLEAGGRHSLSHLAYFVV